MIRFLAGWFSDLDATFMFYFTPFHFTPSSSTKGKDDDKTETEAETGNKQATTVPPAAARCTSSEPPMILAR
jgi:hypothetical protein